MKVYATWPKWPKAIPKDPAIRNENNNRWRADLERPVTPEEQAEDRRRIADQEAKDYGLSGLFE